VDLSVRTHVKGDHAVVEVNGAIDLDSSPRLRAGLIEALEGGCRHLVVDLRQVDFIDSSGLRVLVGALKRARAGQGSLRLVITDEHLLRIFRIAGLVRSFPIHLSVEDATAAAGR
jgi:anti-sigma B factor antagonist